MPMGSWGAGSGIAMGAGGSSTASKVVSSTVGGAVGSSIGWGRGAGVGVAIPRAGGDEGASSPVRELMMVEPEVLLSLVLHLQRLHFPVPVHLLPLPPAPAEVQALD